MPMFDKLCTYYPGIPSEQVNAAYHDLSRKFKDENSNRELPLTALVHHLDNKFGFTHRPLEMEDPILRGTGLFGPAPGAMETLRYLKANGYRIGVLSNTRYHSPVLRSILDDFGFMGYIDAVVASADIGYRKPAPQAYDAILCALNCHARDCFFCGDSEAKDYYGPLSVGFKAAVLLSGDEENRDRGIVSGIGDVPSLFEK